jgi:hypothetical protein
MRAYLITNYTSIGITMNIGIDNTVDKHMYPKRVMYFTIGILFWTYIINIHIKQN